MLDASSISETVETESTAPNGALLVVLKFMVVSQIERIRIQKQQGGKHSGTNIEASSLANAAREASGRRDDRLRRPRPTASDLPPRLPIEPSNGNVRPVKAFRV